MTPSPGNRLSGGLHLPHPPLRIARDKRNSGYRYAMCRECAVRLVLPHDPRVYDVKLRVERPTPSSFCHSGRMATDTYESDASLAAFRAITEAPYVLRKQVDGRGRVSSRCALLVSAFHRYIGPFNRHRITPLNRFRIVEDLASSGPVVRTQFPKLPLAFVPPKGSVLILVVENSPKLETRVGNGQWNTVFRAPSPSLRRIAHGYPDRTSPIWNRVPRADRSSISSIPRLPVRPLLVDHHRHQL